MMTAYRAHSRQPAGFSLIEVAISLLILGLIIAPLMLLYSNHVRKEKEAVSYENIDLAVTGLQNYRRSNGFYPCPAPMNVPRTDANYGRATACNTGTIEALDKGECDDGVCVEQAEDTVTGRWTALTGAGADPEVIVGAVPFRDLQIDEDRTYDVFGGRLQYSITKSMTAIGTFNDDNGAIRVTNAGGNDLTDPPGSAAYVVLHLGETQAGAFSEEGTLIAPCPNTGPLDRENCIDPANPPQDSVYISSRENDAPGANFYDDEILYFSQISEPTWKRTVAVPENIEDLSLGNIGVGPNNPDLGDLDVRATVANQNTLYVNGPAGTPNTGGTLYTDSICDGQGNCFAPELLAGSTTTTPAGGMYCGAGTYMTGIADGHAICENDIQNKCPTATPIMRGFDGSGNPICVIAPGSNCSATTRTECGTTINIAAAADTYVTSVFGPYGSCRRARYKCTNGTWGNYSGYPSGVCADNTPTPSVTHPDCGPGYGGATYTRTITAASTCGAGASDTNTRAIDCICVGASVPDTKACSDSTVLGGAWQGTATRTIDYSPPSCLPNNPPWNTSACTCAPPQSYTKNCNDPAVKGGGWTGTSTRTVTRSGPGCVEDDPAWPTAGCNCDPAPIDTPSDHVCDNPTCEEPDPGDRDISRQTIDPVTCTAGASTKIHDGKCRPKGFTWVIEGASGAESPSLPAGANFKGQGCSCADHAATEGTGVRICYVATDPNNTMYRCNCQ